MLFADAGTTVWNAVITGIVALIAAYFHRRVQTLQTETKTAVAKVSEEAQKAIKDRLVILAKIARDTRKTRQDVDALLDSSGVKRVSDLSDSSIDTQE